MRRILRSAPMIRNIDVQEAAARAALS